MSEEDVCTGSQKPSSVRGLQFTPPKAKDVSLISSSIRKKRKDPSAALHMPAAKQVKHKAVQLPSHAPEEFASPELRRKQPETKQSLRHEGDSACVEGRGDDQARTANPPRPPPDLPPGIPAPPIPQGRVPEPGPDHGHLPPGTKPKGVLRTIFSPMFHLFQPGDSRAEDAEDKQAQQPGHSKQEGSPGDRACNADLMTPERQEKGLQAEDSPMRRLGNSADKAHPDELRQNVPDARGGQKLRAGADGKEAGPSKPAVLEGASSTDEDSGTCLGVRGTGGDEESESGSELDTGEEVYVTDAGHDLDADSLEFNPYTFIRSLPPLEQCAPPWRELLLPRQTRQCKRKTLVLDLDETLVHSTLDGNDMPDFHFEVSFNSRTHSVNVRQRPHLAQFLQRCANLFEVVIFTASQKLYAEQLLNILDPDRKLIRHRIFRDSCVLVEGNYLKDLSVLGRDLAQTIIVDNSPQAFGFQLANGVPIESWYDDESDNELMQLLPFLESLVDVPDVRPVIINAFKLHQLVDQAPRY